MGFKGYEQGLAINGIERIRTRFGKQWDLKDTNKV